MSVSALIFSEKLNAMSRTSFSHIDDFGIDEQRDHDHSRLSNVPKNERSSRMNILPDTDSDTLTNTMPDTDNVDLTPKHKINTPILEETESTLEAEVLRSRRGRARCIGIAALMIFLSRRNLI